MSDKGLVGRRTVVTGALAMAATTAAAAPARAAGLGTSANSHSGGTPRLATAGLAAWQAAIGSHFIASTEVGRVTLRLSAVHPLPADGTRPAHLPRANAFEAVFVPVGAMRPAGHTVYVLAASGRDPMPVYFAPSAGSLAAVFN